MQKNLITNKYPRTFHLPFSPGRGKDDKVAKNINNIFEKDIIITEKLDGSNVCLETNICYARSHSHPPTHKSFDIVKSIHSNIKHLIPENYQVFCENLFAKHSIYYSNLISCLFIIGIRDIEKSVWLSVEENILWSNELNIPIVPILFDGKINCEKHLEKITNDIMKKPSTYGVEKEGIVIRPKSYFSDLDFSKNVFKFVRANHITTDEHWKNKPIERNGVK